ncbi:hypothetical protein SGRIM128S_02752 [Streptomyces griseomycini]
MPPDPFVPEPRPPLVPPRPELPELPPPPREPPPPPAFERPPLSAPMLELEDRAASALPRAAALSAFAFICAAWNLAFCSITAVS